MDHIQETIVKERIYDLHREAEFLRTERRMRHRPRDGDGHLNGSANSAAARRARVRVGHWLIGVGLAISGSAGDAHGGKAEHAA